MITEDYISFETAKLLANKGYEGPLDGYYNDAGYVVDYINPVLKVAGYQYYGRVSLYMAMKWLREVHSIPINVLYNPVYYHHYKFQACIGAKEKSNAQRYDTYEQACEAGIKYCLNNII